MCENSGIFNFPEDDIFSQFNLKNDDKYIQGGIEKQERNTNLNTQDFRDILRGAIEGNRSTYQLAGLNYDDMLGVAEAYGANLEEIVIEIGLTPADMN